ncbi:unnamed protein product [Timema podura]|uniref:Uncharacterized protein n=1 Tax=Timema podura TaxID=61482 RepID=A0ABN7NK52_TIMPD|nr:unnamed protein product [Timema podura]
MQALDETLPGETTSNGQPKYLPGKVRPSCLNIAGIECFPEIQGKLPHAWSLPQLAPHIRLWLEAPLVQQAAFDDLVYEVDIMRNVATRHTQAAKEKMDTNKEFNRRPSLPAIALNWCAVEMSNNQIDSKPSLVINTYQSSESQLINVGEVFKVNTKDLTPVMKEEEEDKQEEKNKYINNEEEEEEDGEIMEPVAGRLEIRVLDRAEGSAVVKTLIQLLFKAVYTNTVLYLTVQSALVSFLRTCTGRATHPLYCLDRSTTMFSKPSVMIYPLYLVPKRTPVSIGSRDGHCLSSLHAPMGSPCFSHWTRPGSSGGYLIRAILFNPLSLSTITLPPTATHVARTSSCSTATRVVGTSFRSTATNVVGTSFRSTATNVVGTSFRSTATNVVGTSFRSTATNVVGTSFRSKRRVARLDTIKASRPNGNGGSSPISPGIGQEDPSVYFDATEENNPDTQMNNNSLDELHQEKERRHSICLSPVLEERNRKSTTSTILVPSSASVKSKIPVPVKSPRCSMIESDAVSRTTEEDDTVGGHSLPLRRCVTLPDARAPPSNNNSSTEEEQQLNACTPALRRRRERDSKYVTDQSQLNLRFPRPARRAQVIRHRLFRGNHGNQHIIFVSSPSTHNAGSSVFPSKVALASIHGISNAITTKETPFSYLGSNQPGYKHNQTHNDKVDEVIRMGQRFHAICSSKVSVGAVPGRELRGIPSHLLSSPGGGCAEESSEADSDSSGGPAHPHPPPIHDLKLVENNASGVSKERGNGRTRGKSRLEKEENELERKGKKDKRT